MKVATTVATSFFFFCNVQVAQATSIKMDFLPAGFARTDPIISQTCLSDHVHTFYGPQAIRPETDYDTLINTPDNINTGNVVENKSLYWHPTVYSYDRSSDTYTRDTMAQSSAYYIWENGINTKAFPNGFRMIAGLNPDDPANHPNAVAECVGPSPCEKADCYTENTFFPSTACAELEVSMRFPTCWDGVSLDSTNHQDHVRYTLDGELDGPCPNTHQVRIPKIELFFRIAPYDGGWHTFSDLSSVYHADYMSGWDENKLQSVLDDCDTDSFAANPDSFCEQFLTFRDAPKCTDPSCDFGDPQLLAKLQAIQPPPMDVKAIVSPEETEVVVGSLPRGTCTDTLLPSTSTNGDGNSPAPTPAPIPECFSPSVTTLVEGKGLVTMKDLRAGDKVMTSSGEFQTVYDIDHFHSSQPTEFLQVHTTRTQQKPLELTPLHMIFLEGKSNPVPAKLLKVGDYVQMMDHKDAGGNAIESSRVTRIESVVRNGFFNALTTDGTIVVDGVVSSTYPALSGTEYIEVGGMKLISHHDFVHMALIPIRIFFNLGSCISSFVPSLVVRSNEKTDEEYFAWYSQAHSFFFSLLAQSSG